MLPSCLRRNIARQFSTLSRSKIPQIKNEPFQHFAKGSVERAALVKALEKQRGECPEVPCVIGGKEIFTGNIKKQVCPADHQHVVCTFHNAGPEEVKAAKKAALEGRETWMRLPVEERLTVFLKAAELMARVHRYEMMAKTMLGVGKTVWQAEIDCSVELIDFWRFAAKYVEDMYAVQPPENEPGVWNRVEYRPLEGFVQAITPFNFAAIGANLPSIPAILGNGVIWKPSSTAILQNYFTFQVLQEAGLPDGTINFLPTSGATIAEHVLQDPDLAAVHFTGSTQVFNSIWRTVAMNMDSYRNYPRLVGETGGKNFHFIHPTADFETAFFNTIRGAFEYQGQKCSATSRCYIPKSQWARWETGFKEVCPQLKMGQPDELDSFLTGVIDESSFDNIRDYIDQASRHSSCELVTGGKCDKTTGYFVQPTVIRTTDPRYRTMCEEIFGPVLTVYVYPDEQLVETLELCDTTATYGLTGSFFAQDRAAITLAHEKLRNASGNFYVNDKCTGAIVGQQPFGGARGSGTNDKAGAGAIFNRFSSMRSIKENFMPLKGYGYPSMEI